MGLLLPFEGLQKHFSNPSGTGTSRSEKISISQPTICCCRKRRRNLSTTGTPTPVVVEKAPLLIMFFHHTNQRLYEKAIRSLICACLCLPLSTSYVRAGHLY